MGRSDQRECRRHSSRSRQASIQARSRRRRGRYTECVRTRLTAPADAPRPVRPAPLAVACALRPCAGPRGTTVIQNENVRMTSPRCCGCSRSTRCCAPRAWNSAATDAEAAAEHGRWRAIVGAVKDAVPRQARSRRRAAGANCDGPGGARVPPPDRLRRRLRLQAAPSTARACRTIRATACASASR